MKPSELAKQQVLLYGRILKSVVKLLIEDNNLHFIEDEDLIELDQLKLWTLEDLPEAVKDLRSEDYFGSSDEA
jgi:hypothetical protein